MDTLFYLAVLFGFVATVALIEGAYFIWSKAFGEESRRMRQRLQTISASGNGGSTTSLVRQRLLSKSPGFARFLMEVPRIHELDRLLVQSGLDWSVSQLFGLMLFTGFFGLVIALLLALPLWVGLILVLICLSLPVLRVTMARSQRLQKIETLLPDGLDLMSRAMRAGHAFPSALQMVGQESPEPLAAEFRTTFEEINYGISTEDALQHLAKRVPIDDLRYFVVSVSIQRSTGGDLAEILDNISLIIRARLKLFGTIRVLSSEGRLSAWILTLMPFCLGAAITFLNSRFLSVLWTDPAGLKLVCFAAGLMLIGVVWMWRMIKIRV